MTLEERIVNALRAERRGVPAASPGPIPHRPRRLPRVIAVAALTVGLVAAALVVVEQVVGRGTVAAGPNEVALGNLLVPVTGEKIMVSGVLMDVAAPAPALQAGVEMPGVEVTLDRSEPPGQANLPNDTDGPMVYVGTVAGVAVVLHDDDPPVGGLGEEVASWLNRVMDGPMYCANTDGCSYATGEPAFGLGYSSAGEGPFVVNATGFELPPQTAAVSVTTGDGASYWQRPAGNSITIRWQQPNQPAPPYVFVGYDSEGTEVAREVFG